MGEPNKTTIRVAIIDDHAIVREGLRMLLTRHGLNVVAEGGCGDEAQRIAREQQPDVMLLDIRMKECDGLSALPHIRRAAPQTNVIMLTTYANPGYLARAINEGAVGYLSKETAPEKIVEAIHAAASKSQLFDHSLLTQALQKAVDPSEPTPEPTSLPAQPLSNREIDVVKLLAVGMSNADIAEALNISLPTVKTHVQHILQKLHVTDRTQAALWAVHQNMV